MPSGDRAASGAPSPVLPESFRRPPAPPTRADPVLPWSDSLPTRVDISGMPPGSSSAKDKAAFGNVSPESPPEPTEKFSWREITWGDAADEPGSSPLGAGGPDNGEQDNAGWDRPVTASAASVAPPATASPVAGPAPATPSWLDDVDDASDAGHPLSHPARDESSPATVDEADDLPGSGAPHHARLSADSGAGTESGAGAGTGDSFDLEATAALPIVTTSLDADAGSENAGADAWSSLSADASSGLDTDSALDAEAGLGTSTGDGTASDDGIDLEATAALPIATNRPDADNTGGGAWSWLSAGAGTNLNAPAGHGTDADTDLEAGTALDTGADPDDGAGQDADADAVHDGAAGAVAELPGTPDGDEPVPADPDAPSDGAITAASPVTGQVTVVPGVPRYHDETCILIRFMDDEDVQRMTVSDAEKAGCTPCRACQHED